MPRRIAKTLVHNEDAGKWMVPKKREDLMCRGAPAKYQEQPPANVCGPQRPAPAGQVLQLQHTQLDNVR